MSWLLFPAEQDWVRFKRFCALLGLVAIDDSYEQARYRIHAVLEIGFVEVHVSLVLDVVVASPPRGVLAVRPSVPRLEGEVIPSDQNFLRCDLAMGSNAGLIIIDVVPLCRAVDPLANDLAQDIDFGPNREQQLRILDRECREVLLREFDVSRGRSEIGFQSKEVLPVAVSAHDS